VVWTLRSIKTKPYYTKKQKRNKLEGRILKSFLVVTILLLSSLSLTAIQQKRYDIDNYHCVHMSDEVKAFFDFLGFETRLMTGIRTNDQGELKAHRWVQIKIPLLGWQDFEATTLTFSDTSKHYYVYKIIEDDRILDFPLFD
jgi:hypothetical protein